MPDKDLKDLSTFQFGLILIAGLSVFSLIVAGLAYFRNQGTSGNDAPLTLLGFKEKQPDSFHIADYPDENEAIPPEKPVNAPHATVSLSAAGLKMKKTLPNKLSSKMVTDPKQGMVFYIPLDEISPEFHQIQSTMTAFPGHIYRFWTSPEKLAHRTKTTAQYYQLRLEDAESNLASTPDGVEVIYRSDLDFQLTLAQSGYLRQVRRIKDMRNDGVPGIPSCADDLPSADELLAIPKLPTFDRKMRKGERLTDNRYTLPHTSPNPLESIAQIRDHISRTLDCIAQAKNEDGVDVPTGFFDVTMHPWRLMKKEIQAMEDRSEQNRKDGLIQGALQPGEIPELEKQKASEKTNPAVPGPEPGDSSKPVSPEGAVTPTFVKSTDLPKDVYGPLVPGEIPPNEITATPTPKPTSKPTPKP